MKMAGSADINVTPLIDVLLVLLIIFIVMIPVVLRSETVELPPNEPNAVSENRTVMLKLDADLSVAIDDGPTFPSHELAGRLRGALPKVSAVFIDAVDGVQWGQFVATVDTVRGVADDVTPDPLAIAVRVRGDE